MAENRVKITISADGKNAEQAIGRLNKNLKSTTDQTKRTSKGMRDLGAQAQSVMGTLGAMAGAAGLGMVISSIDQTGRTFEKQMATVRGVTRATSSEFAIMASTAKHLGATTEWSATQSADALNYLGMAGFSAAESAAALPGVLDMATAGNLDLGRASDIVTDSLTAMGMGVQDLTRFSDVMVGTITRSNTNIDRMGQSMRYVAPVAAALGYEIEEVSALLGTLANAGIKGEQAGTNLAAIMLKNSQVAQQFGTAGDDLVGTLKAASAAGWGATEMQEAYGLESVKSALILQRNIEKYGELETALRHVQGETERLADIQRETGENAALAVDSAIESVQISLYERYADMTRDSRLWAADYIRGINDAIDGMDLWLTDVFAAVDQTAAMLERDVDKTWVQISTGAELLWTDIGVFFAAGVTGIEELFADLLIWISDTMDDYRMPDFFPGAETYNAAIDQMHNAAVAMKEDAAGVMTAAVAEQEEIVRRRNDEIEAIEQEYSRKYERIQDTRQKCYDDILGLNVKATEKVRKEYQETQEKKEKALKDFDRAYEKLTKSEYELARDAVEDQVREWEAAGADIVQLKEREADQLADILERETRAHRDALRAQTLASDDFFGGMSVGWQDVLDEQITWGQAGYSVVRDFTDNATRALSNDLFSVLTGDMDNIGQLWDDLWSSMLHTMTDTVARMAVEWATSQLLDWGSGFISAIFHDGTPFVGQDEIIAKLQTGEMVIPRKQADVLRSVVGSGEGVSRNSYFSDVVDTLGSVAGPRRDYGFKSMADPDYAGMAMGNAMSSLLGAVAMGYNNYSRVQSVGQSLQGTVPGLSSSRIDDVAMDMAKSAALDAFVNGMFGGFVGDLLSYELGVSEYSKPAALLTTGLAALSGLGLPGAITGAISPLAGLAISGVMDAMHVRSNETLRDSMERAYGTIGGRRSYQAVSNFLDNNWGASIDPTSDFGLTDVAGKSGKVVGYQFGTGFISVDSATGVATNDQGKAWTGSGWTDLSDWGLDFADQLGSTYGTSRGHIANALDRSLPDRGFDFSDRLSAEASSPSGTSRGHIANALDRSLPDWGFDFSDRLSAEASSPSGNGYHDGSTNYGGSGWNDSSGGGGSSSGHNVGGERGSSTNTGGGFNDGHGGVTGLWTGGIAEQGHRYWINERGSEMFMPGQDGRVLTAQETSTLISTMQQIAKGGGLHSDVGAALVAIARYCQESSKTLKRWDYLGMPEARA